MAGKRPIVIGQQKVPASRYRRAWSESRAARRLWGWFGLTETEFLRTFDTTNVLDADFDPDVVGSERPLVVVVGRKAERKLTGRVGKLPRRDGRTVFLPHPSGRNRLLNDPLTERRTIRLCREVTEELRGTR